MVSPTFGVASDTAFAIARSLCRGMTKALSVSFPGFGSVVDVSPVAVLVNTAPGPVDDVGASTFAVITNVWTSLRAMSPTSQTPVPGT